MVQPIRTGLLTVGWLLVLPCLAVLLSALAPILPWVRIYLVDIVPNHATWLLIASLAALAIAASLVAVRKTVASRALLVTASVTLLLATLMTSQLLLVAGRSGARIDLAQTLSWRSIGQSAAADESYVYVRRDGREALSLDVYRGRGSADRRPNPAMIVVHGGGFARGSRTFGAANMRWYADRGWTVISIDYRLAHKGRPTWNLATRDVECALAWTAEHAKALDIDMERLTLAGPSAGGSLAMAAAYAGPNMRSDPVCGPRVPRVAATIVKVPLIDALESWDRPRELRSVQRKLLSDYIGGSPEQYPERYAALNPTRYLPMPIPPTLLFAGSDDPLVPPGGAADFERKARAAGRNVRRIVFPYSGHDFNTAFGSIPDQVIRQQVLRFMEDHAGGAP